MNIIKVLYYRLLGIEIIKVFSLNAMATLVRMCAGMISVKVIAVIIAIIKFNRKLFTAFL